MAKPMFARETDLCAAFIQVLPEGWVAYPETEGWDILLVRKEDGFQIGVQAKLKLNAKVILQTVESTHGVDWPGPDCRAVLVPAGVNMELQALLPVLGITVMRMHLDEAGWKGKVVKYFYPELPTLKHQWSDREWYECCPMKRHPLPDFVPDTRAGSSAPLQLTAWKVKAIRIAISLQREGSITRTHFKHFQIDMSRWTQQRWLIKGDGGWVAGPYMPDFKRQHPRNFAEYESTYDTWRMPGAPPAEQVKLL